MGVCWAVFYAFFFWRRFPLRPALQGLLFAIFPATLALLIVYPELALMRVPADIVTFELPRVLRAPERGRGGKLPGCHALFGLTMGAMYRRPVGYPAGANRRRPPDGQTIRPRTERNEKSTGFISPRGSSAATRHREWALAPRRDGFDPTLRAWQRTRARPGNRGHHIRYGPPLHLVFEGPAGTTGTISTRRWRSFASSGRSRSSTCAISASAWLGNFQNPDIGGARGICRGLRGTLPWVRFYTPVNEMYVCARMSALDGLWNEQLRDEGAYARAAWNLANASIG